MTLTHRLLLSSVRKKRVGFLIWGWGRQIWSLCDPALTGCIRRPEFFAAMRLIALAQASPTTAAGGGAMPSQPLSLAGLEATRYLPLPPPKMDGFAPNHASAPTPNSPPVVPAVSLSAATSVAAPLSFSSPGGRPAGGNVDTIVKIGDGRSVMGAGPAQNSNAVLGSPPPVPAVASFQIPMAMVLPSLVASNRAGEITSADIAVGDSRVPHGGVGALLSSDAVQGGLAGEEDDDEDFGDFTAAEPETQDATADDFGDFTAAELEPEDSAAATATQDDEVNDDDFGDFAGAPSGEAAAARTGHEQVLPGSPSPPPSMMPAAAVGSGTALANQEDIGWMVGHGEVSVATAATGGNGAQGGGLEDLIRKNMGAAEAPAESQAHLANMVRSRFLVDVVR